MISSSGCPDQVQVIDIDGNDNKPGGILKSEKTGQRLIMLEFMKQQKVTQVLVPHAADLLKTIWCLLEFKSGEVAGGVLWGWLRQEPRRGLDVQLSIQWSIKICCDDVKELGFQSVLDSQTKKVSEGPGVHDGRVGDLKIDIESLSKTLSHEPHFVSHNFPFSISLAHKYQFVANRSGCQGSN